MNQWLTRYCLLRPIQDLVLSEKLMRSVDKQIARFPNTDWLLTIKALALTRSGQAEAAANLMRQSVAGDWRQLDAFEKSIALLSLRESGNAAEAAKVQDLYLRNSGHRFPDLAMYARQLVSEANEDGL